LSLNPAVKEICWESCLSFHCNTP